MGCWRLGVDLRKVKPRNEGGRVSGLVIQPCCGPGSIQTALLQCFLFVRHRARHRIRARKRLPSPAKAPGAGQNAPITDGLGSCPLPAHRSQIPGQRRETTQKLLSQLGGLVRASANEALGQGGVGLCVLPHPFPLPPLSHNRLPCGELASHPDSTLPARVQPVSVRGKLGWVTGTIRAGQFQVFFFTDSGAAIALNGVGHYGGIQKPSLCRPMRLKMWLRRELNGLCFTLMSQIPFDIGSFLSEDRWTLSELAFLGCSFRLRPPIVSECFHFYFRGLCFASVVLQPRRTGGLEGRRARAQFSAVRLTRRKELHFALVRWPR